MSEETVTGANIQTRVLSVQENGQTEEAAKEDILEIELPTGNDLAVLQALGGTLGPYEELGRVSFQGIRRKLGLHQETLSRSLHRLEREGLIQKINQDYAISERGESIVAGIKSPQALPAIFGEVYAIPIMRAIIPPDASISEIERSLSHRWFGSLRWFGSSKREDSTILSWITEDGKIKLFARISEGYLSIESEATTKDAMTQAVAAAYEVFDHISHHLRRQNTTVLFATQDKNAAAGYFHVA